MCPRAVKRHPSGPLVSLYALLLLAAATVG